MLIQQNKGLDVCVSELTADTSDRYRRSNTPQDIEAFYESKSGVMLLH